MITVDQVAALHTICPGAKLVAENNQQMVFLPSLKIKTGSAVKVMDAVLYPAHHSGYTTRLFLAEPITEKQQIAGNPVNWSAHQLLSKTWHTWSWQNVPANLPLLQMLLAHVKALV